MTKTQTAKFRRKLEENLRRADSIAAGLEEQARAGLGGEAGGNLSNTPMHLGDLGSETYSQELSATLLEGEMGIRDEIVAALNRLDDGTFGTCEACGTAIVPERLEAIPHARHCTPCAAKAQNGGVNLNAGRPRTGLGAAADDAAGHDDSHAAGNAGGGTAVGGLAGTNVGRGNPQDVDLDNVTGTGTADRALDSDEDEAGGYAGISGGAVGGTPAGKRARGGRKGQ